MKFELTPAKKEILEWVACIVIAVILSLLVRYYFGTPTMVKQSSMYPTLVENQRLVLNKWFKTTKQSPQRGDIITFEAPTETGITAKYTKTFKNGFEKFTYNVLELNKTSYIKRVIGLPGEHVQIINGKVYINEVELVEDYLVENVITTATKTQYSDIIVPENTFFVMGDNRLHSDDSRKFGCVPKEKIESKVLIRFWPLNLFGKVT